MKTLVLVAAAAAICAGASTAATAQAATPQAWYWSTERAASVARVPDQPKGCSYAVFHSWIGNCLSPDYTYGGPTCVGVGPRTISATDDIYLYKTFSCIFGTKTWTPDVLRLAHQRAAQNKGGLGGPGIWINDAVSRGKGNLRVQVTDRFTALVTWLGRTWTMTIQPTG